MVFIVDVADALISKADSLDNTWTAEEIFPFCVC